MLCADPAVFLGKRRCSAAETDSQLAEGKCELLEKVRSKLPATVVFYLIEKFRANGSEFHLNSALCTLHFALIKKTAEAVFFIINLSP